MSSDVAWLVDWSAAKAAQPETADAPPTRSPPADQPPSGAMRAYDDGSRYIIVQTSDCGTQVWQWAGLCSRAGLLVWTRDAAAACAIRCPFLADALAAAICASERIRRDRLSVKRIP